jgi:hypothetical protein
MDRFHWSTIAKETRVDWTNWWYSITVYSVGQQKKKNPIRTWGLKYRVHPTVVVTPTKVVAIVGHKIITK